jgi:PleD family two-component response regulator
MQTVLIVDNSRTVRKILQERIVYELRLETQVAATLDEARHCIERNPFAFFVAVLGLTLADAPNGEIVDYVLARNIPAIVLTASPIEDVKAQILSPQKIISYIFKSDRSSFDQVVNLIQQVQYHQQSNILVVMASVAYREHVIRLLEVHRYVALEAENGEHALKILGYSPDVKLMIVDYAMSNMGGLELIAKVRKMYRRNQLAIIGLFAAEDHEASANLIRVGADDFLAVPFTDEEFYHRITRGIEFLEFGEQP